MRRSFALLSLVWAGGCDRVFNLQEPPPADALVNEECPATYDRTLLGKQYRFVDTLTTWALAEADCRNDSVTAISHLPVFGDVVEREFFHTSIELDANWILPVGYARDISGDNTTFRAVTGEPLPLNSELWGTGEPTGDIDNNPGETQVFYVRDAGGLVDAPPTWSLGPWPYMCQCDGVPATETFVAF